MIPPTLERKPAQLREKQSGIWEKGWRRVVGGPRLLPRRDALMDAFLHQFDAETTLETLFISYRGINSFQGLWFEKDIKRSTTSKHNHQPHLPWMDGILQLLRCLTTTAIHSLLGNPIWWFEKDLKGAPPANTTNNHTYLGWTQSCT